MNVCALACSSQGAKKKKKTGRAVNTTTTKIRRTR
jgi:hypothetical protein